MNCVGTTATSPIVLVCRASKAHLLCRDFLNYINLQLGSLCGTAVFSQQTHSNLPFVVRLMQAIASQANKPPSEYKNKTK